MSAASPPATDAQLLPKAAAGNTESLAELYERHREGALAVAISVLSDVSDAEDVVQDVFVQLPRMARSYDPARGEPAQWLLRSVRNRAIDHYRRRARRLHRLAPSSEDHDDPLDLIPAPGSTPVEAAEAEEFLDLLSRLDARHAQLIRLAFVEGWSHSAIAGITGLPLGTVKSRIRVGLRLVRSLVADIDLTPRPATLPPRRITASPLLVLSRDASFAAAVHALADGLIGIDVLQELPHDPAYRPSGIIFDQRRTPIRPKRTLERLRDVGWDGVPTLVWSSRWSARPLGPRTRANGASAYARALGGSASALIAALLSTASDPSVRVAAIDRLMASDDLALLLGDRLGRVTAATSGASILFDRAPRDLIGLSVTELSAMPKRWTERQWQRLAGDGWWSGQGMARLADGHRRPTGSVAWLVPSGGFLSAAVALEG